MQTTDNRMPPRAIVLSLEQLSRRCLGCYGHGWIETPHLDRLAARSVVFDQCLASPANDALSENAKRRFIERLSDAGIAVCQLNRNDVDSAAESDDLNETGFAKLMHQAEQALIKLRRDPPTSWLFWLESPGIGWPGIATPQFVELYADELEDVPEQLFSTREIEVAYAALVTQFDHLLGRLLTTVDRLWSESPPMLILMAAHGEAVGELEMLAPFAERSDEMPGVFSASAALRDELVRSPLLIANGLNGMLGSRRQELVTPADVLPTLCEWFGLSEISDSSVQRSLLPLLRNEDVTWRTEVILQDEEGHSAVRTERFLFVRSKTSGDLPPDSKGDATALDDSAIALFLKPEDVWEVNDVAAQHPDEVSFLAEKLASFSDEAGPEKMS